MPHDVRVLFLADSHLGFDLPVRPRVARRRRGHDFLASYHAALAPALAGEVDLVIHGGDVFHRARAPASLAYQAFEPLARVAERGVPVFVVPGNHERSRLPYRRHASHRGIHVFDRPRTFGVEVRGVRVALAGFPFERRDVRGRFPELLAASGWEAADADVRLLCIHQCVEGATVGPGDFTFTGGDDVVRCGDLPAGLSAVLSGHIHRHQVLTTDLRGRPLAAPVLYPGSLERTSVAEIGEPKGFMLLRLSGSSHAPRAAWEFRRLPVRPMLRRELDVRGMDGRALAAAVRALVTAAPADAVLRIRLEGVEPGTDLSPLASARLRALAPDTMNLEVRIGAGGVGGGRSGRSDATSRRRSRRTPPDASPQLELGGMGGPFAGAPRAS
jgi:DNA repair exonuclease SbcCD nuclease subunit